ncbi:ABC transporter substrate-binding protein [Chloroflexota bacterium]
MMKLLKQVFGLLLVLVVLGPVVVLPGMSSIAQDDTPVTLDIPTVNSNFHDTAFDPVLASEGDIVENLFLGLTDIDPATGQVVPEMATDWAVSEDGLTWTFTLRSDVNWAQYDPASGEVVPLAPVVADDFVYGIKRGCDPRIEGNEAGYTIAHFLMGCDEIFYNDPAQVTDEMVYGDLIGVSAVDDTTLTMELWGAEPCFDAAMAGLPWQPAAGIRVVPIGLPVSLHGSLAPVRAAATTSDCTISAGGTVNMRAEPSTAAENVGGLPANVHTPAVAQMTGADGFVWWYLAVTADTYAYVRSDVVNEQGTCDTLPQVDAYDPSAPPSDFPPPFVSNGPYVLINDGIYDPYKFVRNPLLPADLQGSGNIDVVQVHPVDDPGSLFMAYMHDEFDTIMPSPEDVEQIQNHGGALFGQLTMMRLSETSSFGFAYDRSPFDNAGVRRAFSAIIDRDAFVTEVKHGQGQPTAHVIPGGLFGDPYFMGDVDPILDFSPEVAQTSLTQAGYPGCAGLPPIKMAALPGTEEWMEFWKQSAVTHLGCDPANISVEPFDFSMLYQSTRPGTPDEYRPSAWAMNWHPMYPDASQWMKAVDCGEYAMSGRPCTEVDDLIEQAAQSTDPDERAELYAEIEAAFFGPEGEFPIAPIFLHAQYDLTKPWYTGPFEADGLLGSPDWGSPSIDMEAKLAARGE